MSEPTEYTYYLVFEVFTETGDVSAGSTTCVTHNPLDNAEAIGAMAKSIEDRAEIPNARAVILNWKLLSTKTPEKSPLAVQ